MWNDNAWTLERDRLMLDPQERYAEYDDDEEDELLTDEEAYEKLCVGCPQAAHCHETCDYCDDYLWATEKR